MRAADGRVVSNFIVQALGGQPLTIFGDGTQTRSLCYVEDTVAGLLALFAGDVGAGPVNIGNPNELTIADLARLVIALTGSQSTVSFLPLPADDPHVRRPDIGRARERLGWTPNVDLRTGLERTIEYFRREASTG
jgi:UDP-glucuronate decarboxylase